MNAEKNRERLFSIDEKLRAEADAMLEESGLGEILREEGFHAAGSYEMRTMTWKDLDFERTDDSPTWEKHWALGLKLTKLKWVWSAHAINGYIDPRYYKNYGHYWGLRAVRPGEKNYWKLDLWTARQSEWDSETPKRKLWEKLLTEDTRYHIMEIKEAVCNLPEYRNSLLSIHIYEAVLEEGIRGTDAFMEWWRRSKA
jgi:hypothetical protein